MFFHKDNFKKYLGDDQANLIAKVANKLVATKGSLVFGRSLTTDECKEFSTNQKGTDTHVGIIIGLFAMGAFEPSETPIQTDMPTKDDELRAAQERAKSLELENLQLRGKK